LPKDFHQCQIILEWVVYNCYIITEYVIKVIGLRFDPLVLAEWFQFDLYWCIILSTFTGQKFGFDARNALVMNEVGAEIDSIEVIRDNDKLFIVEDSNM
jgi:hypothetical protein